jgi:hypothetical protein
MITAIYMYKLNSGVNVEEFKKWSIEEDQKIVNNFEEVGSFEVFFIKSQDSDWDVFEIIKVSSWEKYRALNESPQMKSLKPRFKELVNKRSVVKF